MELRVRDLTHRPLGSASFVDLRLPEGQSFGGGGGVLRDTLAIHAHARLLRVRPALGAIQSKSGRLRPRALAHVGVLFVSRADMLYVAYLNPADDELLERVKRIRAQGYHWLCMYDRLANFGITQMGPITPEFLQAVLEVHDEAKGASDELFERAVDEVDWTLKHTRWQELLFPMDEGDELRGTVFTNRTPRPPQGVKSKLRCA